MNNIKVTDNEVNVIDNEVTEVINDNEVNDDSLFGHSSSDNNDIDEIVNEAENDEENDNEVNKVDDNDEVVNEAVILVQFEAMKCSGDDYIFGSVNSEQLSTLIKKMTIKSSEQAIMPSVFVDSTMQAVNRLKIIFKMKVLNNNYSAFYVMQVLASYLGDVLDYVMIRQNRAAYKFLYKLYCTCIVADCNDGRVKHYYRMMFEPDGLQNRMEHLSKVNENVRLEFVQKHSTMLKEYLENPHF